MWRNNISYFKEDNQKEPLLIYVVTFIYNVFHPSLQNFNIIRIQKICEILLNLEQKGVINGKLTFNFLNYNALDDIK